MTATELFEMDYRFTHRPEFCTGGRETELEYQGRDIQHLAVSVQEGP